MATATVFEVRCWRPEWMDRAACANSTADFSVTKWSATVAALIQRYCRDCPVRAECRQYGRASRSTGVWGGRMYASR